MILNEEQNMLKDSAKDFCTNNAPIEQLRKLRDDNNADGFDRDTWKAYNYIWNDEQTDAVLADAAGSDRTFTVQDPAAPGGKSQRSWHFVGPYEKMTFASAMPSKSPVAAD